MVKVPVPYTEDGHLGGAAAGFTGEQAGKVHEYAAHAAHMQKCAEHDECEDHGGGNGHGHAVDTVGDHEELFDERIEGYTAVPERFGEGRGVAEQGIDDEGTGDKHQRPSRGAARGFQYQKNGDDAVYHVLLRHFVQIAHTHLEHVQIGEHIIR